MTTKAPKPTPPLTELQRHVLDYLHVFLALNDCLPPAAHIAREFGWSSANSARLRDAISEAERADLVIEAAAVSHSKIQRAQRLKCVGNGVVALQAAAAAVQLVGRMRETP